MSSATATNESDSWLDRHLPTLAGRSVFEIGCGGGRDTRVLVNAGCAVVAIDSSSAAIQRARAAAPAAEFRCQDCARRGLRPARGHPAIGPNYYSVDGQSKRFFDRAAVDALLAEGWNLREVEERTVLRYTYPKVLREIVATKAANDG